MRLYLADVSPEPIRTLTELHSHATALKPALASPELGV